MKQFIEVYMNSSGASGRKINGKKAEKETHTEKEQTDDENVNLCVYVNMGVFHYSYHST